MAIFCMAVLLVVEVCLHSGRSAAKSQVRGSGACRLDWGRFRQIMGRPVEDMDDEFRDWIIDFGDTGYVASYRVDQQSVLILAVRHQKEAGF